MKKAVVTLAAIALLTAGCANHIRNTEQLEPGTGNAADKTPPKMLRYDVSTPYNPLREIYEIPFGIVGLVASLVLNIADVCVLGMIPNSFIEPITDWSAAAANPFMNTENESRTVMTLKN
jgi:hypothetical protein